MERRRSHRELGRRRESGITLIELLVVMVIISLFATLVGARLFGRVERARQTTAKTQITEFETVLDLFRLDTGRYPTGSEGLRALQIDPGIDNWDGPYLNKDLPPDPWGNSYVYRNPGRQGRAYEILALGADGQEGGEDENLDIVSWQ